LTTGFLAGSCSECTATNTTLCNPLEPVCLLDLGICGCATDQSCGAVDSGLVCSGAGGLCQPGCGPAPRNGCPAGQSCSTSAGSADQCIAPTGCASDNDCTTPLPRCDTGAARCVGCLGDTDCPAPMLCDGATHTCLECTTTETQNCGADLAGRLCLPGGKCGCAQDSDCGGPTSGRVCDPGSSRCVPGCRGSGGNKCPAGEPCSSTTTDIGSCNGQQPADGGTGGADGGAPRDGGTDARGGDAGQGGRDAGRIDASADAGGRLPDAGTGGVGGGGGTSGDAGPGTDGGGRDAGGANQGGYIAGGGCACTAAAESTPTSLVTFAVFLFLAIGWARRRQSARRARERRAS